MHRTYAITIIVGTVLNRLVVESCFIPQGIKLISSLIDEYSLPVVQAYMKHIQVGF